jgi:hypothetical protein
MSEKQGGSVAQASSDGATEKLRILLLEKCGPPRPVAFGERVNDGVEHDVDRCLASR